ncbi:protein phosphatase [Caldicellulosiruptor bescii]|jgi:protein phosphatase|uniref:Protein serine/threonine phosphatase n=2 Tax=Caldicellulosiruptor bescii TaxID=31899 RepID=B9MR41_CALBD|nr:Stp1/IreP family PP2C-type Ser/Thr phosphatase [Caldicellulosiruptor bescii]ACM60145.1 protein serine/threonine phosphatase [Caldicellulosiruptor bescii DSM 6725]PBC87560.1 protein phosphatase [Caldicellulosiruptor bescii]PBC90493.1 protein phosphatase [Caldicellulosiruptor bescii]PBD04075.1 protein phosphatase [Caldicellulosiruptor bescii]PBD06290.1 protein phosphatase [Caldicellulosiruptor bescii]
MKYVKYVALTEKGNIRTNNEDYYIVYKGEDGLNVFLIADGMGGHSAGEVASSFACQYVLDYILLNQKMLKYSLKEIIKEAYRYANQKIINHQIKNPLLYGMGTTLAGLFCYKDKILVSNIGDSRVYIIDNNEIRQITEDHSLVYEMFKDGKITKEEIYTHPKKNIITRAIGIEEELEVDLYEIEREQNKDYCFLMCTDGLTNMVFDTQIHEIFKKNDFYDVGKKLIEKALEAGGIDNITIVYLLV